MTERVEPDRRLPLGMFEDTVCSPQRLRLLRGERLVLVAHGTGGRRPATGTRPRTVPSPAPSPGHAAGGALTSPRAVARALRGTPRGAPDAVLVLCLDRRGREAGRRDAGRGTAPGAHADRAGVPLTRRRRV
ncbi:hypothetical protein [Streptomyces sp. NPDC093089]|uniref:hypothetical protein n=1 Tax=Streptomyces sp. NPDC093089 TaxID=3366024 RepID=UPI003800ABFC